jgi:hypothetical protein
MLFWQGRQKLAATLSEKKKSGYGILGQCREEHAQNGTLRPEQIDWGYL